MFEVYIQAVTIGEATQLLPPFETQTEEISSHFEERAPKVFPI
jgi:hypothetical protein